MAIEFPLKKLDQYDTFAYFEKCFSHEECESIKGYFLEMFEATVGDSEGNEKLRKSKIRFVNISKDTRWIFQKLYDFAIPCNDVRWKFQLSGFHQGVQLTHYDGDGSHYDWHTDNGNDIYSTRKLSLILLLSDPDEYDGGEIEFIGVEGKRKYEKGTLLVFPSFIGHKVHPVISGTRRTAVAWICGEPYR